MAICLQMVEQWQKENDVLSLNAVSQRLVSSDAPEIGTTLTRFLW